MALLVALGLPVNNWPPLSDLDRFPPHVVAVENRQFASAHRRWICVQSQIGGYPGERMAIWEDQAVWCWRAWDLLEDATCQFVEPGLKREKLAKLRNLIGEDNYSKGRMPPPAPVWRFGRL